MKNFLQSVLFWCAFTCAFVHMVLFVIVSVTLFIFWIHGHVNFWVFFGVYVLGGSANLPLIYYFFAIPLRDLAHKSGSDLQKRFASTLQCWINLGEHLGFRCSRIS